MLRVLEGQNRKAQTELDERRAIARQGPGEANDSIMNTASFGGHMMSNVHKQDGSEVNGASFISQSSAGDLSIPRSQTSKVTKKVRKVKRLVAPAQPPVNEAASKSPEDNLLKARSKGNDGGKPAPKKQNGGESKLQQ